MAKTRSTESQGQDLGRDRHRLRALTLESDGHHGCSDSMPMPLRGGMPAPMNRERLAKLVYIQSDLLGGDYDEARNFLRTGASVAT